MPRVYYNPANPHQLYWTILDNDANVPAGYVDSQGVDGAQPAQLQQYVAGVNSGGYPRYIGQPDQASLWNGKALNGVLNDRPK